MSNEGAVNLIRGLVGSGGIAVAGRQIAATLLKVIPGVNFINAAVAARAHRSTRRGIHPALQRDAPTPGAGKPMPEAEMLPFLLDAYQKAFKKPVSSRRAKADDGASSPPKVKKQPQPRGSGSG